MFVFITDEFLLSFVKGAGAYYLNYKEAILDVKVEIENEKVLRYTGRSDAGGKNMLVFEAAGEGETDVRVSITPAKYPDETFSTTQEPMHFFVTKQNFIYTDAFLFSSFNVIASYFAVKFLAASAALYISYRKKLKTSPYSHRTILYLGLCMFFLMNGIMFGRFALSSSMNPENYNSISLFMFTSNSVTLLIYFSVPLILVFSLFMIISNASLIRHEGYKISNLLGFIISFLLIAGSVFCVGLSNHVQSGIGEHISEIPFASLVAFVSTAFLYFECYLFATI